MLVRPPASLTRPRTAHNARMSTDPGLDRHEWESELQGLEPELADSPREALPELLDLVERILDERGYAPGDPVAGDGDEPEILAEYRAARDVARALERDDDISLGDVAAAISGLRGVAGYLIAERSAP